MIVAEASSGSRILQWVAPPRHSHGDPTSLAPHEWVAMPSRGSSQPKDRTQVSRITSGFFYGLSHQGSP